MAASAVVGILGWLLGWSVLITAASLGLQRLARRAPFWVQLVLVVAATAGVFIAGIATALNGMAISEADLSVLWLILALAAAVAIAMSLVLGLRLSRSTSRLIADAARIGRGEVLTGRLRPSDAGSAELAALAGELTHTSRSLDESRAREADIESARRELVTWISHDLRTPLAAVRAMAEALDDGVATDAADYHRRMITETDHMASMVNDLLELSTLEAGTLVIHAEPLELYDLASDVMAELAPLAARRGVTLGGGPTASCRVLADARTASRALKNVVLNAVMYSIEGGTVTVGLGPGTGGTGEVWVQDTCGGIGAEDLPRLFDPGWRKSASRTRGPGGAPFVGAGSTAAGTTAPGSPFAGAGVGLSVVAGILRAHGGTVAVENRDGGCRFTLAFPLDQTAGTK
ncbi:HAMP domain-containing sensor histidine kinase [Sinomonas sp. ASV486]|uniref:sensor histidine kinase n=1 Tax=Sinomonas sp. ASV486 TaxID=3051170 RepID=UPI0027DAFDF8|nr:HAMP domain-containing sensor histidine kinase [Sinomonas sp. ASV486]MDQ4489409.1 HAMP domain-containing sensor histidine kinase [Sinomonas sp. ASV486]